MHTKDLRSPQNVKNSDGRHGGSPMLDHLVLFRPEVKKRGRDFQMACSDDRGANVPAFNSPRRRLESRLRSKRDYTHSHGSNGTECNKVPPDHHRHHPLLFFSVPLNSLDVRPLREKLGNEKQAGKTIYLNNCCILEAMISFNAFV